MSLILEIRADSKKAARAIEKTARKAGADVKRLEKQSVQSANKMGTAFQGVGKMLGALGIGLGLSIAIRGFKNLITESIKARDEIAKFSRATGISVEFLSSMRLATERSGSSMQELQVGFRGLLRKIQDVKDGSIEGKRVFDELGISVFDLNGKIKSAEDLFFEVADAIRDMGTQTEKAALAQELFGRSGIKLVPLLDEGAEGIKKFRLEAEKLNLVFGKKQAEDAEKAADAITNYDKAMQGLGETLAETFLPALTAVAGGLTALISGETFAVLKRDFRESFIDSLAKLDNMKITMADSATNANNLADANSRVAKSLDDTTESAKKINLSFADQIPVLGLTTEAQEDIKRRINEQFPALARNTQEYEKLLAASTKAVFIQTGFNQETSKVTDNMIAAGFATNIITSALSSALFTANKLSDILEQIAKQLLTKALFSLVTAGIGSAFGVGAFGKLFAGSFFGIGFQHGGSFKVPGPNVGRDNRLVTIPVGGQETVTVTPANQTMTNNNQRFEFHFHGVDGSIQSIKTRFIPTLRRALREEGLAVPGLA